MARSTAACRRFEPLADHIRLGNPRGARLGLNDPDTDLLGESGHYRIGTPRDVVEIPPTVRAVQALVLCVWQKITATARAAKAQSQSTKRRH